MIGNRTRAMAPEYTRPTYGAYNDTFMNPSRGAGIASHREDSQVRGSYAHAGREAVGGFGLRDGIRMGRAPTNALPMSRSGVGNHRAGGGYGGLGI
jgi:hypothetical protein